MQQVISFRLEETINNEVPTDIASINELSFSKKIKEKSQ